MTARPSIWVLKGLRAGDTAQAMELALQLGGRVEGKQLYFNTLHGVPNWLAGAHVFHLTSQSRALLRPPWPDLVVATGKRTAPVALWIKRQSGGLSNIVQLGRPRMALSLFDLVVTTPQYGLPQADNVMEIPLPFAHPKAVAAAELEAFSAEWVKLPRPWILAVLGGNKFPLRLNEKDAAGFGAALNRLAQQQGGSVILLDSPRSPTGAIDKAAQALTAPHWIYRRGQSVNPYQAALSLCDELVVTSDSVSMVSEMLLTGKPTSIYRLPVSEFRPRWQARAGLAATLAKAGLLHPPRDVNGLMERLVAARVLNDVSQFQRKTVTADFDASHQTMIERVKRLLAPSVSS